MSSGRYFILLIILFTHSCIAFAQIIPFKNYSVKEGLPSNIIYKIAQDKKGYLWFATQAGLVKFDGYNFRTYKTDDGLPDIQINSVVVDDDGKIWCGTENGGVFYVWNEKVYLFNDRDSLLNEPIIKLFSDNHKRIWCATLSNLIYIKNGRAFQINNENAEINNEVYCHLVDSKGNIWLSNADGLFKYDTVLTKIDWCKKTIIRDIIEDNKGRLWFAFQENGIICFDGHQTIKYSVNNGLSSNRIKSLFEDTSGDIYVGTYFKGINIIRNDTVLKERRLSTGNNEIRNFLQDAFGRIWVQTPEDGVYMINGKNIVHYTKENGLCDNMVTFIFEDGNNNIWFATNNGISKYGKVVFTIYKEDLVGSDQNILAVESFNDDILIGSYAGMTLFRNEKFYKNYSNSNGLPQSSTVASIKTKNDKTVWIGAIAGLAKLQNNKINYFPDSIWYSLYYDLWASSLATYKDKIYAATEKGLIIYDENKYTLKSAKDGLPDSYLYSVDVDKKGMIWCGSVGGLSIWDGKKFHNYGKKDGLSNEVINDITIDKNDVAWLATDNGITAVVLESKFNISTKIISVDEGLGSSVIYSVMPDNNNNIWIGHNKGLDCYNTHTKKIKNYGVLEGFLPVETNLGAICMDSHDNIWIGTVEGVVKYSPENDYTSQKPPTVYIKNIALYNDSTSILNFSEGIDSISLLPANLVLPHSKNNLIFDFVGLQYTIVEKNKYKYRLLGYEESWSIPSTDIQTPPYRKLPPGEYVFQVLAANCDGIWTEKPTEFAFQILPPWWSTWWAKISEFTLIVLSIFLIMYLRERKLRYDKKVLTQKVKERTLEIEQQKYQIELQRDEIARQKEEITDSIIYARRIQSAILPKDQTIQPLLNDYFILYKPRDIVSGDFYWISSHNNKVMVIVADCTGHGVPGAFMSMLGVSILNEITKKYDTASAGQILDVLREHIINTLSHTVKKDETREGMDISLCIIDYMSLNVQFAGAFNPLIIVRNKETIIIKPDKMPVGFQYGAVMPFTDTDVQIQKGDCLYMFSDGYADQFGGPDEKKFMMARLRSLLCEISVKPTDEQKQILDDTIENWKGNTEQIDDILVMGIKI